MRKAKNYTKINLRDFRGKLTQLKDSLAAGEVYEVIDRGKSLAYFIPSNYEVKFGRKHDPEIQKQIYEGLMSIRGKVFFKDEVKDETDYKKAYHKLLDKKYSYLKLKK